MNTRGHAVSTSLALVVCALASALLAGCHFDVSGFDLGFVGAGGDGPDQPTDLPPKAFVPSNVMLTDVQAGASSLMGPHDIDTDNLRIDGQPPPVGIVFVAEAGNDNLAVLSVRDFVVSTDVLVHGRRALAVIAVGDARLTAVIHAEAVKRAPGPGGSFTGMGHGGDGKSNMASDSGGGGAGHGAVGAGGGASDASTDAEGGLGGPIYPTTLVGGSGGGSGAGVTFSGGPCPSGGGYSLGGAGGGAMQISAKGTIDIMPSGGIHVGGGGGRGGCQEAASAGGGGGSGGTIWLEAPTMRILGKLAANGGAGGSGGRNAFLSSADGRDGADGTLDLVPAAGGTSRGDGSGAGGAGGVKGSDATPGDQATNGGGGGGAVGHIRFRTSGVAAVTDPTTVISPMQEQTVDF